MRMFEVTLINGRSFRCEENSSILSAGEKAGLTLEHSCLSARCRSCRVKVLEGNCKDIQEELILSEEEKKEGYILSCNSIPLTDIKLDIEDLGNKKLEKSKTLPCKLDSLEFISEDIIKVVLRLPPNLAFKFEAGQYVNIIKGKIKRSYSIASEIRNDGKLEFYIKKYQNGQMSKYWFFDAKENDLLRLEGPLGTFFYRNKNVKSVLFLATGTGIAPIKSILENMNRSPETILDKEIWLFLGNRYKEDIFFKPEYDNLKVKFIPVLSRKNAEWNGEIGYVQDIVLKYNIDLEDSEVYACGSVDMINSAKELFFKNSLPKNQFYSDAFVSSN